MNEKIQFPYYLNSFRGKQPGQMRQSITFQNYFPKSEQLKHQAKILPVSDQCTKIQAQTLKEMQKFSSLSLTQDGKINIYPKKNTIDLKKQLSKKMVKIQKKTQKAILNLAKQLLTQKKQ